MRFARARPAKIGALLLTQDSAGWLVGSCTTRGTLTLDCAGAIALPESRDEARALASALPGGRIEWQVVVPADVRGMLSSMPDLADGEFEQAALWQARRQLQLERDDVQVSAESLPRPDSPATARAGGEDSPTLLIAHEPGRLEPALSRLRALRLRVARLEPELSALVRGQCALAPEGATVAWVHRSHHSGVVTVLASGAPLAIRFPVDREYRSRSALDGLAGVRRVLETLLYVEDRFPRLPIDGLVTTGIDEAEWAQDCSRASGLQLLSPPAPPFELPVELTEDDSWLALFGALRGA